MAVTFWGSFWNPVWWRMGKAYSRSALHPDHWPCWPAAPSPLPDTRLQTHRRNKGQSSLKTSSQPHSTIPLSPWHMVNFPAWLVCDTSSPNVPFHTLTSPAAPTLVGGLVPLRGTLPWNTEWLCPSDKTLSDSCWISRQCEPGHPGFLPLPACGNPLETQMVKEEAGSTLTACRQVHVVSTSLSASSGKERRALTLLAK